MIRKRSKYIRHFVRIWGPVAFYWMQAEWHVTGVARRGVIPSSFDLTGINTTPARIQRHWLGWSGCTLGFHRQRRLIPASFPSKHRA